MFYFRFLDITIKKHIVWEYKLYDKVYNFHSIVQ